MLLTDSQAVRHVRFDWLECYHNLCLFFFCFVFLSLEYPKYLNQAKPYEIQLRDGFSRF